MPDEVVSIFTLPCRGEGRIAKGDPGWGTLNFLSMKF